MELKGFVPLNTKEVAALIDCSLALLKVHGPNNEQVGVEIEDSEAFKEMLIHLESGCRKLINMMKNKITIDENDIN